MSVEAQVMPPWTMMQAAEQRAGIGAPSGKRFSVKVSGLVDAFILATGAELVETDIASCWNLREGPHLPRREMLPLAM